MTQRNRTKWIVLAVVGTLVGLACCVALLLAVRTVVERRNDAPSSVDPGDGFRHDSFVADDGWEVVEERGSFDIDDLTVANQTVRPRSAFFEFSLYRGDELVGIISCSTRPLGGRGSGAMDCFSADDFVDDYDEIRVADSF